MYTKVIVCNTFTFRWPLRAVETLPYRKETRPFPDTSIDVAPVDIDLVVTFPVLTTREWQYKSNIW